MGVGQNSQAPQQPEDNSGIKSFGKQTAENERTEFEVTGRKRNVGNMEGKGKKKRGQEREKHEASGQALGSGQVKSK